MSFESTRKAVAGMFASQWNTTLYPMVANNQPWPAGAQPSDQAWIRYGISPASNQTIDVGNKSRRVTGHVWVQIFEPENKGTAATNRISDAMESIFAEKHVATDDSFLRFERAELSYVGSDAGWHQSSCTVKYQEDSIP